MAISLLVLAACSGSTVSGVVGDPHATPYAGVYSGQIDVTARGPGGTATESASFKLTIGIDGEVTGFLPGSAGNFSCDGDNIRYYLSGNILQYSSVVSCNFVGVGRCSVTVDHRVVVNQTRATISGTENYSCSAGEVVGKFSGYLPKIAS